MDRNQNNRGRDFWCWSRKDYPESYLLNDISIYGDYRNQTFGSFSASFQFNGTNVRCNSTKEWAQTWFNLDAQTVVPCDTSTISVAAFNYMRQPNHNDL